MKRFIHHRSILQLSKPLLLPLMALNPAIMLMAEEQATQLKTMQVVASPVIEENHLDEFSDVSAVVTQEQLRDQNAVDLASALRRTPGVQITRFNPVGAFGGNQGGGVFIRGMGASRPGSEIKTYVDGIPIYMGVWGHPLLDLLPINGMKSITTYKSAQPQINGNNFASINLETKRATEEGIHGMARLSGGYFGTLIEQADIEGKKGDLDYMLAQGFAESDGQRKNANGKLENVMGRVGYKLNENWAAGAHFLYSKSQAGDPGNIDLPQPARAPQYNTEAGMVAINLSHQFADWQGDLKFYKNTGNGDWIGYSDEPGVMPYARSTLSGFDMQGLRFKETITPWRGGEILAGVDSDWTSGKVIDTYLSQPYNTPTFRVTSPFIALSQNIELNKNWSLVPSAGVRYYDHSVYESASSPHAGLSLVSDQATVFVNFSRGVNYPGLEAPTLTALMPFFGNTWKSLKAEQVEHGEVGVKLSPFKSTQIDLSFFHDRIKNRYIFQFMDSSGFNPMFMNLGDYAMRGFEGSIKQGITEDWSAFAGLTLLDPSIDNLPYAPARAVTAGINGQVKQLKLVFDAQYQSQIATLNRARSADTPNNQTTSPFVVVNARASYPIPMLGKQGEAFIAVENLLDRSYGYIPGYPMPGRWGQIGVSASF